MDIDRMKTFAIKDNNSNISLLHFLQLFSIECQIQVLRIWFPKFCFPVACDWLKKKSLLTCKKICSTWFSTLVAFYMKEFCVVWACKTVISKSEWLKYPRKKDNLGWNSTPGLVFEALNWKPLFSILHLPTLMQNISSSTTTGLKHWPY